MDSAIVADCQLTPKEWSEIKDCSEALCAVVGMLRDIPDRAEGVLETLESVQRRLGLAIASAANRIEGAAWECPLCGSTESPQLL